MPRAPRPPIAPGPVPFAEKLPSTTASPGFSGPLPRPFCSRRTPRATCPRSGRGRRLRREGSPSAGPLDRPARSPPCGAVSRAVRDTLRCGFPSNGETVPSLAPAPREHRSASFGSHPHSKSVGPAASSSIRLERSFHSVMTPDPRRRALTSPCASPTVDSRRSETRYATPPWLHCQPGTAPSLPSSSPAPTSTAANFFLSPKTPYARLRASSGRHRRTTFQQGGVPRTVGFPHLLKFLWKSPSVRVPVPWG